MLLIAIYIMSWLTFFSWHKILSFEKSAKLAEKCYVIIDLIYIFGGC